MKLRGLVPNFHIHIPVSNWYIPTISPPILLQFHFREYLFKYLYTMHNTCLACTSSLHDIGICNGWNTTKKIAYICQCITYQMCYYNVNNSFINMKLINCFCFCDALNNIAFDMKGKLADQKRVKSKLFTCSAVQCSTVRTAQYSHGFCLKYTWMWWWIHVMQDPLRSNAPRGYYTVKKG